MRQTEGREREGDGEGRQQKPFVEWMREVGLEAGGGRHETGGQLLPKSGPLPKNVICYSLCHLKYN